MSKTEHWVHSLDPFLFQFTENFGIRYYGLAYALGFLAIIGIAQFIIISSDSLLLQKAG